MDPDRIHAYLQVACAALGFDIGEVWWTTNENGSSTVAAIEHPDDEGDEEHPGTLVTTTPQKKLRFVQLYTSHSYENRRSELLNPPESNGLRRSGSTENLQKHVLSPRLVDAISSTAQVVWANTKKQEGLTGRSDIRLQTAVGMPVAMDENGNMCVVVMFSPNNVQSTDDAMEYLESISKSATSSSIPCLLPVFDPNTSRLKELPHIDSDSNLVSHDLGEGISTRFVSLDEHNHDVDHRSRSPCDEPERHAEHTLSSAPKDTFGIPMLPSFAELEQQQETKINSDDGEDVFDETTYGIWTTIMETLDGTENDFSEQPVDGENPLLREDSSESMALPIAFHSSDPMKVERQNRLEEFCSAFLGMSVFDMADVWVPAGKDYPDSLRHVMSVRSTDTNVVLNQFHMSSENTLIKHWAGAIGTAFAGGNPVWSEKFSTFADPGRMLAFQHAQFRTVLAVPVFSAKQVLPACVVSFYSFVRSGQVQFVLKFVQQALKLLWDGLDNVQPHDSAKDNWQSIGPADLGEMAADFEMQHHFMKKKRPHGLISNEPANADPLSNGLSSQLLQSIDLPNGDTVTVPLSLDDLPKAPEVKVSLVQNHLNDAIRSIGSAVPFERDGDYDGAKRARAMSFGNNNFKPAPLMMPKPLPTGIVPPPARLGSPSSRSPQSTFHKLPRLPTEQPTYQKLSSRPSPSQPTFIAPKPNGFHIGAPQMKTNHNFPNDFNLDPTPIAEIQSMYCPPVNHAQAQQAPRASAASNCGSKLCRIEGCDDPAVSRRPYCAKHSGNRICEKEGCSKCAQGSTRFCIAHGGGRRCTFPGCDKGARDKFFCAAHGGGKRCSQEGCSKSAVGGSSLCTAHGGGRRCSVPGCDKSAQSSTKFCVKHGGGKKCAHDGCEKVARGRTQYCAAHGGGVRCMLEGCNRVAIGKMQLCRAHGGGSRGKSNTSPPPPMQRQQHDQQNQQYYMDQQQPMFMDGQQMDVSLDQLASV
eukprot:scaffold1595_cov171-Amphora_coffeaeformis.AAC.17